MKLLHIIASPRGEKSRTLSISKEFLNALKTKYQDLVVEELDLFKVKLPDIYGDAVDSKYTMMSGGTLSENNKTSWEAISKFSRSFVEYDIYLISSPMWNFSVPYKLKHYIDVIMQVGILFSFTEEGVVGLMKNKKMICVSSRGSDYSAGSPMHQLDYQEPYLRSIFGLAGIYDITYINAQPMDIAPDITRAKLEKSIEEAQLLAEKIEF